MILPQKKWRIIPINRWGDVHSYKHLYRYWTRRGAYRDARRAMKISEKHGTGWTFKVVRDQ